MLFDEKQNTYIIEKIKVVPVISFKSLGKDQENKTSTGVKDTEIEPEEKWFLKEVYGPLGLDKYTKLVSWTVRLTLNGPPVSPLNTHHPKRNPTDSSSRR